MNNDTTETPSSSRHESLESFRPQITGDGNAGGSHENRRKKRKLALALAGDPIPSHFNGPPKPKPGKKPKLGAPNITTPCSVCGKQFWSWKALFGHMRCHPERQWRGINPPSNFRQLVSPESPAEGLGVKFTKEDHEVATCLVLLSNGRTAMNSPCSMVDRGRLVSGDSIEELLITRDADGAGPSGLNCRFECLSCKRVFGSRQALGGHRASHKNIKGCFAIARNGDGEDEDRNGNDTGGEGEVKEAGEEKMGMVLGHKCSICLRVFSSGQALGGHKRCHWEKEDEPPLHGLNPFIRREGCGLDLNLPAPTENDRESSSSSSGLALDLRLGL